MKKINHRKIVLRAALALALLLGVTLPAAAFMGMGAGGGNAGSGGPSSPHGGMGSAATSLKDMKILGHEGNTRTVVARINGTEITMGRLLNSMLDVIMQGGYRGDNLTPEMATRIRKEALQQLALEELAYQRGASLGITADPAVVQAKLDAVSKSQGGAEALAKSLQEQSKTMADLKEEISRFLVVKEAIRREVDSRVVVAAEEINQTYEANKEQFVIPEQLVVTDIVFFLAPDDPAAREKVAAVRRQLVDEFGGNPAKLTPDGFVVESQLNVSPDNRPELFQAAGRMEVGTLSEPLVIDATLHLLKVDYHQPRQEKPAEEAKAAIARQLKANRHNQLLTEWRNNLLKDADIVIVSEVLQEEGK
ncbi:MAG: peptidylprolyl isomerase [Thermodesulfobacteriota bacterium]